jgi:3' terminal RNA ribose 2'-O-methyltransferase Hen1
MLLKITTTHQPATDLGFLLFKHPERFQTKELNFGKVHVFYPEVSESKCTAALLLDINSVELTRNKKGHYAGSFTLGHYVNDRPYVASSFLTTAIAKVYGSALNGNNKDRPELVEQKMPFEIEISVISSQNGEEMIHQFFEPLGYDIDVEGYPLDEQFPEWGASPYFTLRLRKTATLQSILTHLYVLLPALDNNKHYYIGKEEIEKLIEKGGDWLKNHPANELISKRYLKNKSDFTRQALEKLVGEEEIESAEKSEATEAILDKKYSIHQVRLQTVLEEIKNSNAKTVLDLGCGEGKLLKLLIQEKQFEKIVGMDVSYRSLEKAKRNLYYENMAPRMQERIGFIQGALTYKDSRIEGFDAAAIVEVIEHLDESRLVAFEKVVFGNARPKIVVITTPNSEYNVLFEQFEEGQFRHSDHRFEWTRKEFQRWCTDISNEYDYGFEIKSIGEVHEKVGSISQMAIFRKK